MRFNYNNQMDDNWEQKYLDVNQIKYNAANKLVAKDFLLDSNDFKHYSYSMHYILSDIFSTYFLQALNK